MEIKKTVNENNAVVAIEGRLDTTTAPQLEEELTGIFDDAKSLEFDFLNLEYISSAGLRVLLATQKAANKAGGKMVIKNVKDEINEVFEITGFSDILTVI